MAPEAPLQDVAREMALHKYGSAVVAQGKQVLGIFTTPDALRALDTVLRGLKQPAPKKRAKPAAKRKAVARRPVAKAAKHSR